jgi:hypothetical protein
MELQMNLPAHQLTMTVPTAEVRKQLRQEFHSRFEAIRQASNLSDPGQAS